MQGQYAIAKDHFERSHEIWPEDAENLFDLGTVHMALADQLLNSGSTPAALREADRAIRYFDRAIEAHPGMRAAWLARNQALEFKGDHKQALTGAEWAMTFAGPSARAQLFLADELTERGDYDGALLRFRQAIAMEPNNSQAHAALGRFLLNRGHRDQAITHLSRAYELNPLDSGVAELLTTLRVPLPRTTPPLEP